MHDTENVAAAYGLEQIPIMVIDASVLANMPGLNAFGKSELEPSVVSWLRHDARCNHYLIACKVWVGECLYDVCVVLLVDTRLDAMVSKLDVEVGLGNRRPRRHEHKRRKPVVWNTKGQARVRHHGRHYHMRPERTSCCRAAATYKKSIAARTTVLESNGCTPISHEKQACWLLHLSSISRAPLCRRLSDNRPHFVLGPAAADETDERPYRRMLSMKTCLPWLVVAVLGFGCSSDESDSASGTGGSTAAGGATAATGGTHAGGSSTAHQGGTATSGGAASTLASGGIAVGGGATGGATADNGGTNSTNTTAPDTGGAIATGGAPATGGVTASSGGTDAIGGSNSGLGGTLTTGGVTNATTAVGGTTQGAGRTATGGDTSRGGDTSAGGTDAGSTAAQDAGTGGTVATNPNCGALRESVVGWWSFDGSLAAHGDAGVSLTPVPDTATPNYVAGIASGQALDVASGSAAQVNDMALNVTGALTLSAFIKATSPDGRIIDRITAGGTDGYLMDFHNGQLRLIVGARWLNSTATYASPSAFMHVAGVFTGGSSPEIRLYVDGNLVDQTSVAAGDIPSNSLSLRIGIDQNGSDVFTGQIDEPMVFSRALSDQEIKDLHDQLLDGQCPISIANCPQNGLLLQHDESGNVQAGSLECVRANIRRVGDLRVLAGDTVYSCDWNGITVTTVSNCQAWVPFASEAKTGDYFAPVVPLEWRLFKLNTTGHLDQIGTRIETYGLTLHEQSSAALTWFGRDWRVQGLTLDGSGNVVSGSVQALAQQLRAGAGLGVYAPVWTYSLPHLTAVIALTGDNFAGQDPWHISSAYTSVAGEAAFQDTPYHYAVWFDTSGYDYASRWFFGSTESNGDSAGPDAMTFVTEPGWVEALSHDASGAVTAGSLQALKDAIAGGAAVRIGSSEGFFDCNRTQVGSQVSCIRYDSYSPADTGDGHLRFDATHTRALRLFTTAGRSLSENWSDHSADLASGADEQVPLRWFVQASGWSRALATDSSGNVVAGSIADVVDAIENGAEVAVMGEGNERIRCESLRIGSSPTRGACLALPQTLRGMTGSSTNPGYYEARVYNTNGIVASARVDFGSTTTAQEAAPTQALTWFVRRD